MIPIVKQNLDLLKSNNLTFKSIYGIINNRFKSEIFSLHINNGQIVETTYSQMAKMCENTAKAIMAKDKKSDIIGIYMDNSIQWVASFWGILMAGYKPLLLNTKQDINVTNEIIKEVKPAFVISGNSKVDGSISFEQLIGEDSDMEFEPKWSDQIILVTSGSTTKPKIIVHNGKSICSQIELTADILKRNSTLKHNIKLEVKILAFLPFYHIFGLVSTLMWFTFFGRTLVFLSDYGVNSIQHTCQRVGVTHFFAIPLVWDNVVEKLLIQVNKQGKTKLFNRMIRFSNKLQTILPHIGPVIVRNLIFKGVREELLGTNLNFLIAGGGFIAPRTLEVMNGLGCSLYVGYGLTECGILSVNLCRRAKRRLGTSCGPIFTNVQYRINEDGQLEIGKDNCFVGMYVDGEFKPNTAEFYNTNDIVRIDSKNELNIVGRCDDVIITENGENMSPEAIEARLDSRALHSATFTYAKLDGKKQLVLAVEYNNSENAFDRANSLTKLFESINKLPMSERPAQVICLLGQVPYNLKGVNRKLLTEQLENNQLYYEKCEMPNPQQIEQYKSEEYSCLLVKIKKCFADVTGANPDDVTDTVDFVHLGGDSLQYVELLERVSDVAGVNVGINDTPMMTPMAFADYIMNNKTEKVE